MDWMKSLKSFTDSEVDNALQYEPLIKEMEEALGRFSQSQSKKDVESEIRLPVRNRIVMPEKNGFFGTMSVHSVYNNMLATKLLTMFPQNQGIPILHSVVIVFNTETGQPQAIMDGASITAKRTAAASAVATKLLVNGHPRILALIGSGVQAKSHYEALSHLYKFREVRIWNHRKSGAEKLAKEIGETAVTCDSGEEAVKDADVIVTATSSKIPVLKADWVKKGAHINAVGAPSPDMAEVEADLMRSSVVYVDSRDGALEESGDLIQSKASVFAEIGEVINGTKAARTSETTVFESLGIALEDAVAAKIVLDKLN